MAINYDTFVTRFPEFLSYDEDIVTAAIDNTVLEISFYGFSDERKEQAYFLAIAHYLTLSYTSDPLLLGVLKSLETNNDKIEYAVNNVDMSSWLSTQYGQRLDKMINSTFGMGEGLRL